MTPENLLKLTNMSEQLQLLKRNLRVIEQTKSNVEDNLKLIPYNLRLRQTLKMPQWFKEGKV